MGIVWGVGARGVALTPVRHALPPDEVACRCDGCKGLRPVTAGREDEEIAVRCAACGARLHLYEAWRVAGWLERYPRDTFWRRLADLGLVEPELRRARELAARLKGEDDEQDES